MPPRSGTPTMTLNPLVGVALDALGVTLKVAWRGAAGFAVYKGVLLPVTGAKNAGELKLRARAILQPGKVADEKKAAAEAAERAEMERRREETIKEAEEEQKLDMEKQLVEQAAALKKAEEEEARIAKESAERLAKQKAYLEEREAAKQRVIDEGIEKQRKQKEALQKLKEQANRAAAEEKAAAEAKKKAEEEAAAKAAGYDSVDEWKQAKYAEEMAKRAAEEEAAKAAQMEAAAEARAAMEAAADVAAASPSAMEPVGAGYMKTSPATSESVSSLLASAAVEVGAPTLLSLSNLHTDMRTALLESLTELEGAYQQPTEESVMKEQLKGFWKLLITSDDDQVGTGTTGFGRSGMKVLGSYSAFTDPDNYEPKPTLQYIEV